MADELRRNGLLEMVGGAQVLLDIMASTPATTSAGGYARIIEELALLRRLIGVAGEIAEIGYGMPDDVTKALDRAESMVYDVNQRRVTDTTSKIEDLLGLNLDRLEQLYGRGDAITGVPTGYVDLDELLSGLQPSNLVIVGARPAMGKCVAFDTPIVDPATGDVRTAAELHRAGTAGEAVTVLTLDDDRRGRRSRAPSAFVDDGVKRVYRVRTRSGREVRTTASHPFLTRDGWRAARRPGARARSWACRPRCRCSATTPLPADEVVMLAHLVMAPGADDARPQAVDREPRGRHRHRVPGRPVRRAGHRPHAARRRPHLGRHRAASRSASLARRHGVAADPEARRVPPAVFRLPREQLARFLNRALGAAAVGVAARSSGVPGRVVVRHPQPAAGATTCATCCCASASAPAVERAVVAVDQATWVEARARRVGGRRPRPGWRPRSGLLGTRPSSGAVVAHARAVRDAEHERRAGPGRRRAPAGRIGAAGAPRSPTGSAAPTGPARRPATVPCCGTRSSPSSDDGDVQVYDLTVPGTHNFVAADVFVHNTSFALGMASHAALHANKPVLLFSLEMGSLELSQRLLSAEARIDSQRVRTGQLSEDDWSRISQAIGRLAAAPIWIDDNPNLTVMEIRSKARRLKSQVGDLGMVVIDYLQLMTGRGNAENRQVEVSEISRGLKILARELETPVVALSQLSRQLELRADKRPMLADLRESGIDRTGRRRRDVHLPRRRVPRRLARPGQAEIIVAKHRNGPTGRVPAGVPRAVHALRQHGEGRLNTRGVAARPVRDHEHSA